MTTFLQFLEELEQNRLRVVIPGEEVERLAEQFGSAARSMGWWNKGGDGSLEIPMGNIAEAAKALDNRVLREAVEQLKSPEQFTDMLTRSSAAGQLIEALSKLYLQQFQPAWSAIRTPVIQSKRNGCGARSHTSSSAPDAADRVDGIARECAGASAGPGADAGHSRPTTLPRRWGGSTPSLSFPKGIGARTSGHSNSWGRVRYLKRFSKKISRVSGSGFDDQPAG